LEKVKEYKEELEQGVEEEVKQWIDLG